MRNKGQTFDQRFDLCPYLGEDGGVVRVLVRKSMNLRTLVVVIIGLWLNEGVERIYKLTIPHDDNADRTHGGALIVGCLKIYCCKVFHTCSVLIISVIPCSKLYLIHSFSINGYFRCDIERKRFKNGPLEILFSIAYAIVFK